MFNTRSVPYLLIKHLLFNFPVPVGTGRKLNVHKTFRRRPGRLLNVLCTFNLRPVSTGVLFPAVYSASYNTFKIARLLNRFSRLNHVFSTDNSFYTVSKIGMCGLLYILTFSL